MTSSLFNNGDDGGGDVPKGCDGILHGFDHESRLLRSGDKACDEAEHDADTRDGAFA